MEQLPDVIEGCGMRKKRFLFLLLLLFVLCGLLIAVPWLMRDTEAPSSPEPTGTLADVPMETMEDKTFPYETAWGGAGERDGDRVRDRTGERT